VEQLAHSLAFLTSLSAVLVAVSTTWNDALRDYQLVDLIALISVDKNAIKYNLMYLSKPLTKQMRQAPLVMR